MIATQDALLKFWPVFILGILAFDALLLLFNAKMTISRAVIRGPWWFQIALCAGICYIIAHFWTEIVP